MAGAHAQADALRNMAAQLLRMADEMDGEPDDVARPDLKQSLRLRPSTMVWADLETELVLKKAIQIYQFRVRRERFLPGEIFGEPGWDILLDLFVARLQKRNISVTSACIGSRVPATTGLRWLQVLEGIGLVERIDSAADSRVTWVRLTDIATRAMADCLRSENAHTGTEKESLFEYLVSREAV